MYHYHYCSTNGKERPGESRRKDRPIVCAKSLRQERVCHVLGSGRGLLCLECSGGGHKGYKTSVLREGHALTKPIRHTYRNPSVSLLVCRKNSICQGRSLSSLTSMLSPSRKFSTESQITIMILLGKPNTGLVDPLVVYHWFCSSKDLGQLVEIHTP